MRSSCRRRFERGRGAITMRFSHYEEVLQHLAQKIIDKHAREKEEAHKYASPWRSRTDGPDPLPRDTTRPSRWRRFAARSASCGLPFGVGEQRARARGPASRNKGSKSWPDASFRSASSTVLDSSIRRNSKRGRIGRKGIRGRLQNRGHVDELKADACFSLRVWHRTEISPPSLRRHCPWTGSFPLGDG